jgi:hypothetical protein
MEAAKRMVLVDERVLDSLQRKQDSSWRKSTDQVAKSKLNREMKNDLVDGDIPEDVKFHSKTCRGFCIQNARYPLNLYRSKLKNL